MAVGCKKAAFVLGIGCLAVPIGLALLGALAFVIARQAYKEAGPPSPQDTSLSVPLAHPAAPAPPAADAPRPDQAAGRDLPEMAEAPSGPPLRLTLDLEEGEFFVQPGPPGGDVKVEGRFDPRDYELTQESNDAPDMGREVTVRYGPKRSFLVRLLAGRLHDQPSRVTVTIPAGLPTALTLRLRKGASHVELGGLALTDLAANFAMGEHELGFGRPNTADLARAEFRTSMGEIDLKGLGSARAKEVFLRHSMGELDVDFGGEWPASFQSKATIRTSMGEVKVRIPERVRVVSGRIQTSMGEANTRALREPQTEDPNAPTLDLELNASMGEVDIVRD